MAEGEEKSLEEERVPVTRPWQPPQIDVKETLRKAKQYATLSQYEISMEYFDKYLDNVDVVNINLNTQMQMCKVYKEMANAFDMVGDDEEVVKSLLRILNLYPENVIMWNTMAVMMFKRGEFELARTYFDKALNLSSQFPYLPAEKNSLHLTWHQVPRWHFRMLNDTTRNELFKLAIERAIRQGYKKVFDIGAGCGLLSLIAASYATNINKKISVCAFEENKTLANIAIETIKDNNLDNSIQIYTMNSNDYEYKKPLKQQQLIVAEIFDVAVFGEHAMTSLFNAVDKFGGDDFKVIPNSVELFVTGIQSEQLSKKVRFQNNHIKEVFPLLDDVCISSIDIGTYDAEILTKDNCKFVTNTKMFLNVDFRDRVGLKKFLERTNCNLNSCELECIVGENGGQIDALAVWFDLHLDEELVLTTNPNAAATKCWEQAIFYLKHPIKIRKNERIFVQPTLKDNELTMSIKNRNVACDNCFSVSKEIITFLNDNKLVKTISVNAKHLIESGKYNKGTIVDYNPFPLFGLIFYIYGCNVLHLLRDREDLRLLEYILTRINLDTTRFKVCTEDTLSEFAAIMERIDVVFNDCVHVDGSWLKQGLPEDLIDKFQPRILPERIILKVQLINSEYIDFCNKVDDKRCFNFGIARHINKFTGTEHPNLEEFSYQVLSTTYDFYLENEKIFDKMTGTVDIHTEGKANAILFWFEYNIVENKDIVYSTFDSTHYSRACVILQTPITAEIGKIVTINVLKDETYLKIYCE